MKLEEQPPQTNSSPQRTSLFSTHWEANEESLELGSYRQWSILAILSLICGVVSLIAFLYVSSVFIAVAGIPLALWAYFRIQRSGEALIGSYAALFGLFFSMFTLVGVSVMWPYYQYTVRTEADRFFRIWFDTVKAKDIRQIIEMRSPHWHRKVDADIEDWWKSKLTFKGEMDRESVDMFVSTLNDPCMKTLWVLGEQADISYYRTVFNRYYDSKDTVTCLYAVTLTRPEQSNQRETFFIRIGAERTKNPKDATHLGWALSGFPSVVKELPEELKKRQKTNDK